jgi:hypothetical protein
MKLGLEPFFAEIKSGERDFSPRAQKLLYEDTLINVVPPSDADLSAFHRKVVSRSSTLKSWRARRKRVT